LAEWATENRAKIETAYSRIEPFAITNDRLADLLLPLQTVLTVSGDDLGSLHEYARMLDERSNEPTIGVVLLGALREIFAGLNQEFIPTTNLIEFLSEREEEPWARLCHGRRINAERLTSLLKEFSISSSRPRGDSSRGFHRADFEDAWGWYLAPPCKNPANPAHAARPPGYDKAISTPRWSGFARKVRDHWGNRCALCYADGPLEVHHRTYERLGHEELTDCIALC